MVLLGGPLGITCVLVPAQICREQIKGDEGRKCGKKWICGEVGSDERMRGKPTSMCPLEHVAAVENVDEELTDPAASLLS
jgi:hypothetical protein